jgi:hypothetical protein
MPAASRDRASKAGQLDALWLRLAAVPTTPEGVVEAASAHGFLRFAGEEVDWWLNVLFALRNVAGAWNGDPTDPDRQDLSYVPGAGRVPIYEAREGILPVANSAMRGKDLEHALAGSAVTIAPRTLFGFIAQQTLDALNGDLLPSFRRCAHCAGWFLLRRPDQRYCSASHRALHNKKGK